MTFELKDFVEQNCEYLFTGWVTLMWIVSSLFKAPANGANNFVEI